jgi:hypothetical protein
VATLRTLTKVIAESARVATERLRVVHAQVCEQFSTGEVAFLASSIGLIDAWNRIAGVLRFAPPAAAG